MSRLVCCYLAARRIRLINLMARSAMSRRAGNGVSSSSIVHAALRRRVGTHELNCYMAFNTHTIALHQFFKQLAALFEASKDKGSVWLTHKRCEFSFGCICATPAHICPTVTHDGEGELMPSGTSDDEREYACLIRVTNGKDVNISTRVCISLVFNGLAYLRWAQVAPGQLDQFHATYGTLLKSTMSSLLRKRDKRREKQRAEEAIRRKRKLAEDIVVDGSKRGNGRRKRQRLLKRAIRQEDARKRIQEREYARSNKAKAPSA